MQYLEGTDELVLRLHCLLGHIFRSSFNGVVMGSSSANLFHPLTLFGCVFAVNAHKIAIEDQQFEVSVNGWNFGSVRTIYSRFASVVAKDCISSTMKRELTKCCSPKTLPK